MGWYTVRISTLDPNNFRAFCAVESDTDALSQVQPLSDLFSGERYADHPCADRAASSEGGVDRGDGDVERPLLFVENVDSQLVDG